MYFKLKRDFAAFCIVSFANSEVGKTSIILTCDKNYKLHAFYNSSVSQLWIRVDLKQSVILLMPEQKYDDQDWLKGLVCARNGFMIADLTWPQAYELSFWTPGAVIEVPVFAQQVLLDASSWLWPQWCNWTACSRCGLDAARFAHTTGGHTDWMAASRQHHRQRCQRSCIWGISIFCIIGS